MDVDRFQAVGSRWPTSLPTVTVHLQRGPETTHRKWDQPGPALPTLLLAQQVHERSSQRSSLSPRLMHLLQMLLNVWAASCRPMLNLQQDQSSSKENMTFGDKLITSEFFNPGESNNLSLLGLKHILGMGLSFLLFKSSLSFCILTSPPNSYFQTLSPAPIHHFVVLQFTTRCRYCIFFFLQIEGLRQPWLEHVYQCHFPTAFAHSVSLCHILIILGLFQTFSLWLYLFWWSVISDLWCYYCRKITVLKDQMMASICFWQ